MEDNYYHNLLKRYHLYNKENYFNNLSIAENRKFDKWYNEMKELSENYIKDTFSRNLNTELLFKAKTIEEFDLNLSIRGYS